MVFNKTELGCVEELWEEFLSDASESGYTFLVAEEDNQVAGFVCYGPHSLTEGAYDIYWIAVDPAFQHKGVGGALIQRAEDEISKLNGSLLILETSSTPPYQPARDFYTRQNFTLEASVQDFYAIGDHLMIYTKHLNKRLPLHEDHLLQQA
jgi:D-alanine-D-alanine ligase